MFNRQQNKKIELPPPQKKINKNQTTVLLQGEGPVSCKNLFLILLMISIKNVQNKTNKWKKKDKKEKKTRKREE